MKCKKCDAEVDVSSKKLLPHYVSGKRKVIVKCPECEEQHKIRMFVTLDVFVEGVDTEIKLDIKKDEEVENGKSE